MSAPDPRERLDPDLLLAQAGWIRGLAQRLLRDEHLAEDVVQETWLAALSADATLSADVIGPSGSPGASAHPGQTDGGALRPWLARVARNLALKKRRTERNRGDLERQAAGELRERSEASNPGAETERLRRARDLMEAVLGLDDPYRSALILRYFDGLSTVQVAERQGIRPAAARQRLTRGVAMLRARLDGMHGGDRSVWQAGLAGFLEPGIRVSAASTLVLGGGALVGVKWIVGILGVAGLLALGTSWGDAGRGSPGTESASLARGSQAVRTDRIAASGDAGAGEAALAPVASESRREAVPVHAPQVLPVFGRVVDTAGRGIAGARVRLGGGEPVSPPGLRSDRVFVSGSDLGEEAGQGAGEPSGVPFGSGAVCDADGAFELPSPTPQDRVLELTVDCRGFLTRAIEVRPGEDTTITLLRAPRVRGRVVDPEGRSAAPPGWVEVIARGDWPEGVPTDGLLVTSGEVTRRVPLEDDGTFVVRDLPTGHLRRVSALVQGMPEAEISMDRPLIAEGVEEVELRLEPGVRVTGIVVDDATGEPIPGAEVWADSYAPDAESLRPTARTDGTGRFELSGVRALYRDIGGGEQYVIVRVLARAEGYSSTPTRAFAAGLTETSNYDFEIRLPRALGRLDGRVFDAVTGEPIEGAHVHLIDAQGQYAVKATDSAGRFGLGDLPEGELAIYARHGELQDPYGSRSIVTTFELRPGARESLELHLEAPGDTSIEGRLVSLDGAPTAGVEVEARLLFSARNVALELDSQRVRTDGSGLYRLEGLPPGLYHVAVPLDGAGSLAVRPETLPVTLELHGFARGVDFEIGRIARFGGRALDLSAPPSHYRVRLDPSGAAAGEPGLFVVELSADGSFLLPACMDGTYELRLMLGARCVASESVGPGSVRDLCIRPGP